jgi:hypothetical protein
MPVGHAPIDRRVLAHRRDHNPVVELQLPDLDWFEEIGIWHAITTFCFWELSRESVQPSRGEK